MSVDLRSRGEEGFNYTLNKKFGLFKNSSLSSRVVQCIFSCPLSLQIATHVIRHTKQESLPVNLMSRETNAYSLI